VKGRKQRRTVRLWLLGIGLGTGVAFAEGGTASVPDVWNIDSGPIGSGPYFAETVANGMIGIQVMPVPFSTQQTVIYGAYERMWPGSVSCTVRSFNFLNLAVAINGVRIERREQTRQFHQSIDFKNAAVATAFDYGDVATIVSSVRALRHLPHTALMDVTITAKRPLTLTVSTIMQSPATAGADPWHPERVLQWLTQVQRFNSSPEEGVAPTYRTERAAASAQGPLGTPWVAAAQSFVFDEAAKDAPPVTGKEGTLTFTRRWVAPGTYHFALVGATLTSAHVDDPLNEAQRLAATAAVQGTAALIEAHQRAWADLWKSDIVVEGDPITQRAVHSMLYHLYSFIREGSGYSISPMGLSGGPGDYLGHIFWDADTWMFPALLALHTELARGMLDYRYERLAAARKNAAMNGYRGASFPWESAATGDEDVWSDAMGAPEVHITGDVALAAWNYYRVTQDRQWLRERGYPLLKETADYWSSRVTRNGPGHYDIDNVVAADEYADDVNNDAFTNAAAKVNLMAATEAARILGVPPNPDWEQVRQNIPILEFSNGVIREHATYKGEKIKQADVDLLAYPLQIVTDPQAVRRDLDYYVSRNDDAEGPAMTKSIFAILYERTGTPDKALRIFKSGYEPNQRPPFGVLAETASSENPYFATAAGGLLQALLYGFGGLEITDQGLVQHQVKLPAGWKSLTLTGVGPEHRQYTVR
jgi:trehalose/maltose hydrolase-like predicted phosphorylase